MQNAKHQQSGEQRAYAFARHDLHSVCQPEQVSCSCERVPRQTDTYQDLWRRRSINCCERAELPCQEEFYVDGACD